MSSVQLLDKTRKISKLLHNNSSSKVVFNDICSVLCEILGSNVLVISKKGKVLGVGDAKGVDSITELIVDQVGGFIDAMLKPEMLRSFRQSLPLLKSQVRDLGHYSFTNADNSMTLMISFCVSMEQLW